jgi:hypothetical protein
VDDFVQRHAKDELSIFLKLLAVRLGERQESAVEALT